MRNNSLVWSFIVLSVIVLWFAFVAAVPAGKSDPRVVSIPKGASAKEISRILSSSGVVRSAFGFQMLAIVTGKSLSLKPGAYELSPSMTALRILDRLHRGELCAKWITVPEGFTIRQIAERLEAEGICRADVFAARAGSRGVTFRTGYSRAGSAEGYLFPDTYLFASTQAPAAETSSSQCEDALIDQMLAAFERKVAKPLAADIAQSGMTLHEVVTLASLVEREARTSKDRPLVSAVLRNRLRKNMRLECDATVLYALGAHKDRVLYRDLNVDSPYNTYRYAGLPPGPIANPGLAAIEAALRPAPVDFLYYVAREDGSHIFSRTFEEHQRAVSAVRKGNP